MLKHGKYRALRNIPVGWLLQAIHATDRSERRFRILVEIVLVFLVSALFVENALLPTPAVSITAAFIFVHTCMWFITGNFWVYILDSFKWVRNPGLETIVTFVRLVQRTSGSEKCCQAILIYGSMCRSQFHDRSDLDLRILRRTDTWRGLLLLPLGFALRTYSFFIALPVDLQVVDSIEFLKKQMRHDERPIIVFRRRSFDLPDAGIDFAEVARNPSLVVRQGLR